MDPDDTQSSAGAGGAEGADAVSNDALQETIAMPGSQIHFNNILADGQYSFFAKRRYLRLWLSSALEATARRRAVQLLAVRRFQRLLSIIMAAWRTKAAADAKLKQIARRVETGIVVRRFFMQWRGLHSLKRSLAKLCAISTALARRQDLQRALKKWSSFSSEAARSEALRAVAAEKGAAVRQRHALRMLRRNARIRAGVRELAARVAQHARADVMRAAFVALSSYARGRRAGRNSAYLADAHATAMRTRRAFRGMVAGTRALQREKLLYPVTRKALQTWRDVTTICKRARVKELFADGHCRRALLLRCWGALRANVAEAKDERRNELLAVTFRSMALQQGVMTYWRSVAVYRREQRLQSDRAGYFWARHAMARALQAWKARHAQKKKSTQARMHRMAGVLRAVMGAWHAWAQRKAGTSVDFARRRYQLLDWRAAAALRQWRAMAPVMKAERQRAALVAATSRRSALCRLFSHWKANARAAAEERRQDGVALRFWRRKALELAFKALRRGTALQSHLQDAADVTQGSVTSRYKKAAWRQWRAATAAALEHKRQLKLRASALTAHLRSAVLRRTLRLWSSTAKESTREQALEAKAAAHHATRLMRAAFSAWAGEWLPERRSKRDKAALADRFDALRASSRAFRAWRHQHAEVRHEARQLTRALEHRARVLSRQAMQGWKRWLAHRRALLNKMFRPLGLEALFPTPLHPQPQPQTALPVARSLRYSAPDSSEGELDVANDSTSPHNDGYGGSGGDAATDVMDPFAAAQARLAETEELLRSQRLQREREDRRRKLVEPQPSTAATLPLATREAASAVTTAPRDESAEQPEVSGSRRSRPKPRGWAMPSLGTTTTEQPNDGVGPAPTAADEIGAGKELLARSRPSSRSRPRQPPPVSMDNGSVTGEAGAPAPSSARPVTSLPLLTAPTGPAPAVLAGLQTFASSSSAVWQQPAPRFAPPPQQQHPASLPQHGALPAWALGSSTGFPPQLLPNYYPPAAMPVVGTLPAQPSSVAPPAAATVLPSLLMSPGEAMDAEAILSHWAHEHEVARGRVDAIVTLRQRLEALRELQLIRKGGGYREETSGYGSHSHHYDDEHSVSTAEAMLVGGGLALHGEATSEAAVDATLQVESAPDYHAAYDSAGSSSSFALTSAEQGPADSGAAVDDADIDVEAILQAAAAAGSSHDASLPEEHYPGGYLAISAPSSPSPAAVALPDLASMVDELETSLAALEDQQAAYEHKWRLNERRVEHLQQRYSQHRDTVASVVEKEERGQRSPRYASSHSHPHHHGVSSLPSTSDPRAIAAPATMTATGFHYLG